MQAGIGVQAAFGILDCHRRDQVRHVRRQPGLHPRRRRGRVGCDVQDDGHARTIRPDDGGRKLIYLPGARRLVGGIRRDWSNRPYFLTSMVGSWFIGPKGKVEVIVRRR